MGLRVYRVQPVGDLRCCCTTLSFLDSQSKWVRVFLPPTDALVIYLLTGLVATFIYRAGFGRNPHRGSDRDSDVQSLRKEQTGATVVLRKFILCRQHPFATHSRLVFLSWYATDKRQRKSCYRDSPNGVQIWWDCPQFVVDLSCLHGMFPQRTHLSSRSRPNLR